MKKKSKHKISVKRLETLADRDGDTTVHFDKIKVDEGVVMEMGDLVRRNIDYSAEMFSRLAKASQDLNVSVQAIA
jgi:hypothetical protein